MDGFFFESAGVETEDEGVWFEAFARRVGRRALRRRWGTARMPRLTRGENPIWEPQSKEVDLSGWMGAYSPVLFSGTRVFFGVFDFSSGCFLLEAFWL